MWHNKPTNKFFQYDAGLYNPLQNLYVIILLRFNPGV